MQLKHLLLFFSFLVGFSAHSQKQEKTYYDYYWNTCKKKEAVYYRLITFDENENPVGMVRDYYKDSDAIQFEGKLISAEKYNTNYDILTGLCIWYYESGNPSKEANYVNGKLDGMSISYYENGNEKLNIDYTNGIKNGIEIAYYQNGNLKSRHTFNNGQPNDIDFIICKENGICNKYTNDTFRTEGNPFHWPLINSDEFEVRIAKDEGLFIKSNIDNGIAQFIEVPIDFNKDFILSTSLTFKSGSDNSGHGLLWGFKNWDNYFYFNISANGHFKIASVVDGVSEEFSPWTFSESIHKQKSKNHLEIVVINGKANYFINNKFVARHGVYNIDVQGTMAGFYHSSGIKEVKYKYLHLVELGYHSNISISKSDIYLDQAQQLYTNKFYQKAKTYLIEAETVLGTSNGEISSLNMKLNYDQGHLSAAKNQLDIFKRNYLNSSSKTLVDETLSYIPNKEATRCRCNVCGGNGEIQEVASEETIYVTCPQCDGKGGRTWSYSNARDDGGIEIFTRCTACNGEGYYMDIEKIYKHTTCDNCGGDGDICK